MDQVSQLLQIPRPGLDLPEARLELRRDKSYEMSKSSQADTLFTVPISVNFVSLNVEIAINSLVACVFNFFLDHSSTKSCQVLITGTIP